MFTISYEKFTLPNGLEVILHEDHTLPIVAVNIWYHVGSKDEEAGKTGFAHLFEHVMFEGSKHHNESFFEPLQKVGANLNGSTSADRTNYWENVPSNYLELALWLEADRMGFLLDALDQERFDVQRDVVKNERRQSYENRPYGMAHLILQPAVFPAPHPYSWSTIGSQEDLDAAALDDVKAFFRKFYAPSNASLALAGDFDGEGARRMIERQFGDIPPGPAINRVGRMDSDLAGLVHLTMQDKVQLHRMYLVWPTCPMLDKDEAPLDILGIILGDGKSSRLHRILVRETQIARDVSVGHYAQEISGEFHIQVTANVGHSLEEIEAVVETELDRMRGEPPTSEELQRAKNRIESDRVRQLERSGGFGGRADQLNLFNVFANDPGLVNTDIVRYGQVEAEDIQRVASLVLGAHRVRLSAVPEQSLSASERHADRSSMPEGAPQRAFTPPVPQRGSLSNGLDLLVVEKRGLPTVAFGLFLPAGVVTDPVSSPGLAQMTATMLPEGTATRTAQQISDQMEFFGAHLASVASREHAVVAADTLTPHWPKALAIMADVVKNATFPPEELERVRKERLTDLKRIADDPVAIAGRASRALLYGPESRYGHPATGTLSSVEALTRDELVSYFNRNYGPRGSTLIVAGDVSIDEVAVETEAHFGDWKPREASSQEAAPGTENGGVGQATIFLADKPGAAQSVIQSGYVTIPRDHPDFYAMTLLNDIFGGQFSARLNMNLRQSKGYSYGYTSMVDWVTGPSAFLAGGAVQTAVTKEAIVETLKEFSEINGPRPVTSEEFDGARDGIIRGFPSQFETQHQLVALLSRMVLFGLPDTYFSNFVSSIEAVTLEEVRRVASERITAENLKILVVGDRTVVESGIQELDLPVVLVDHEGRRIE